MHLAHLKLRKNLAQGLVAVLEVLEVDVLALLNEREHDISLSAKAYLPANALIELRELGILDMLSLYGLAARWQLVDDTDVEVAIKGHGKST